MAENGKIGPSAVAPTFEVVAIVVVSRLAPILQESTHQSFITSSNCYSIRPKVVLTLRKSIQGSSHER